jgi:hypothetical protein
MSGLQLRCTSFGGYVVYEAGCGTVPSCLIVALKADCIEISFSALIELVFQHVLLVSRL